MDLLKDVRVIIGWLWCRVAGSSCWCLVGRCNR